MNFLHVFLVCVCSLFQLQAQCIYTGKVMDVVTTEPLVGVAIGDQAGPFATTDLTGHYRIERPCSDTIFTFSLVGYEPIKITVSESPALISMTSSNTVLNQLVISASRYEQDRSSAPIAISSISAEMLDETKPQRLDEVLNKVAGVYMVDLGSEQHTIAIRQPINYKGLFLYLEDGVAIRPTGVFNHNALLEMNMAALSRIEVIRGPASSLYGSEAIGGAINFISLRPSALPSGRVSIQGNSIGYSRADINASSTFGKLGLGVYGYYARRHNGIREHTDFNKMALTLKSNYVINDRNTLGFGLTYIDYYADMTGSLDSAFFFGRNYSSQQTFTNREVDALRLRLDYHHYWDDDGRTSVTAFARDNSIRQNPAYRVQDDFSPWSNPTGNKNRAHGEINEDRVRSIGLVAQHNQTIGILGGSQLSVGLNLDVSPDHFWAGYISIDKSDDGIYTGFSPTDSVLTDYEALLFNAGTYANLDINLTEWLQLTAALRYDRLYFDFRNNLDEHAFSGAPDEVDNFSALTPKIGLTWNLGRGKGLFTNYSEGFLPPQISELYRGVRIPVLQPSVYRNYEIGGYFQWQDRIGLDFSIYQMNGTNEIITVMLDDGSQENRNAGKTTHRGIEYGLKWQISDELHFRFSGTNTTHLFDEYEESGNDYAGNEMGQAPSWIANADITYKPDWLENFRWSLEWQHVDKYFMDHANTGEYPGYNLMNIRLSYEFWDVECWVHVINVANSLYATVVRRSEWGDSYHAGEPRTINVGVAYQFKSQRNQ